MIKEAQCLFIDDIINKLLEDIPVNDGYFIIPGGVPQSCYEVHRNGFVIRSSVSDYKEMYALVVSFATNEKDLNG